MGVAMRFSYWMACGAVIVGAVVAMKYMPTASSRTAALLQIPELPSSVSNLNCRSRGWQEDFTQCAGKADLSDIPALMAGWAFAPSENTSTACPDKPEQVKETNACYRLDTPEAGNSSYVAFAFSSETGDFYATIFRTGWGR